MTKTFGFNFEDANNLVKILGKKTPDQPFPFPDQCDIRRFAVTGGGGIPACSGSSTPWTPGVAECKLAEWFYDSGTFRIQTVDPVVLVSIYNTAPFSISANVLIQFKLVSGMYVVDVGDCA